MDFARIDTQVDAERGATCHLTNPYTGRDFFEADEKTVMHCTIDIQGMDSPACRRALAKINKRKAKRKNPDSEKKLWNKSVDEIIDLADDSDRDDAELYAHLTTGWQNMWYMDDVSDPKCKPYLLDFTFENAKMIYFKRLWIRKQLNDFLSEESNMAQVHETTPT